MLDVTVSLEIIEFTMITVSLDITKLATELLTDESASYLPWFSDVSWCFRFKSQWCIRRHLSQQEGFQSSTHKPESEEKSQRNSSSSNEEASSTTVASEQHTRSMVTIQGTLPYYRPKVRSKYGKFNIRFQGPMIWNSKADDFKWSFLSSFKSKLKEYLINNIINEFCLCPRNQLLVFTAVRRRTM